MSTLTNIGLLVYFTVVSLIGTLGNGIILLAYGNRWNSSRSTSVIFILILACVDLWTCLIVVPTIAIMEYRDFQVPTLLCRFYSFSKVLIITSSLIMSFIALDRFLNIAVPHYRLLNPRRVKVSEKINCQKSSVMPINRSVFVRSVGIEEVRWGDVCLFTGFEIDFSIVCSARIPECFRNMFVYPSDLLT